MSGDAQGPEYEDQNRMQAGSRRAAPLTSLELGVISRPHGINGEVKVHMIPGYLHALEGVSQVYLDDATKPVRVQAFRAHQGAALLKLEGVETRNDADELRGMRVSIRVRDLPPLGPGEYYSHDLVGMQVVDESGKDLGELNEVLATGSNDVYVVITPEGQELLLPAIESVIREVNLDDGTMKVVVPEGL